MPKKHPIPDEEPFSVQLRLTPLDKYDLMGIAMSQRKTLARLISDEMKAYLARAHDELVDRVSRKQGSETIIDEIPEEKVEHIFEEWDFD